MIAVADASGNVVATNSYDEYGAPASTATGRFGYTGQAWLPELGLYYYKARLYDPKLGRFLQTDPIGYGGGMNLYAYVGGDPVNFVDPLGLDDEPNDLGEAVVTGMRPKLSNGAALLGGNSGGFGWWADGIGGGEAPVNCKLGGGAIDVSFDGTTLTITANINLDGPGADKSGAYIGGIGKAWTQSFGHINSIANISAGTGGLTAHISSKVRPPDGSQSTLGGNEMWLGNLGPLDDWARPFVIEHLGPHEFGHSFGIPNMPVKGKWARSIMANAANNVSETDLEAVVDLCRKAQ